MAKIKRTEVPVEQEKAASSKRTTKVPAPAQRVSAVEQVWRNTVIDLQAREFATLDEALETIVEAVVKRTGLTGKPDVDETRRFVFEMLATDPGIVKEIRACLRIKS